LDDPLPSPFAGGPSKFIIDFFPIGQQWTNWFTSLIHSAFWPVAASLFFYLQYVIPMEKIPGMPLPVTAQGPPDDVEQ